MVLKKRQAIHGFITLVILCVLAYVGLRLLDKCYPLNLARYYDQSLIISDYQQRWLRVYLSHDDKRRIFTSADELPDDYKQLLIHYEDQRFYQHSGIDIVAIIRALGQNIRAGKTISGASTLTMQTAKLLEPRPRHLGSKLIEAFRAWQLEQQFDKDQILSIYTTLAPAGGNLEGLSAAAYYYLQKPLSQLSLGECAWLVALPQSPKRLSRNQSAAIAARNKVLQRGFEQRVINEHRYQQALKEPLIIQSQPFPILAPHFADYQRYQYLNKHTAPHQKRQDNTPILTTSIDQVLQQRLEQLLTQQLSLLPQQVNLAAGILDNASGQWRAYVGSADFFNPKRLGQIDMLRAVRSPGSALKPFITLWAFDWLHYQPQTTIDDAPLTNSSYQPSNYDGRYQGRLSLATALIRSRNVPAVKLLAAIKPRYFAHKIEQHGLSLYLPQHASPSLAIALGGVGIQGEALAKLYRQLANCSYHTAKTANHVSNRAVLASPMSCWQVSDILQHSHDAQGYVYFGQEPVAFKTGTSYGWRDRWLFAYTREYTLVLWQGRADGKFSEKRASSETLIPLLRQVIARLPNPPSTYHKPALSKRIAKQQLPPRLRHVDANYATTNTYIQMIDSHHLNIIAPLPDSIIDYRPTLSLSLHIRGGTPPFVYLLNNEIIAHDSDRIHSYHHVVPGSYDLVVIDQTGERVKSTFIVRGSASKQQTIKRVIFNSKE